jgi:hypothetical protein
MKQWTRNVRKAIKSSKSEALGSPNPFVSLFWMKIQKNGFRKNDGDLVINLLWKVKGQRLKVKG